VQQNGSDYGSRTEYVSDHAHAAMVSMTWESCATSEHGKGRSGGVRGDFDIIPIPREATSVATMIGLLPFLNSAKTQSRSFCCLSP
jgi:hypothetical protein